MKNEGARLKGFEFSRRTFIKLGIIFFILTSTLLTNCSRQPSQKHQSNQEEITVAAASNLTDVFGEIGREFTAHEGVRVTFSFGATADLEKQIENGAPFDLFAAADVEHVDALARQNLLAPGTERVFARGRLVLWLPTGSRLNITNVEEVTRADVERIVVAKPDVAPYGRATVEALRALNLWSQVEPRVIYAQNVTQAKQYAATGNADVAFIPLSLVRPNEGRVIEIDSRLHQPIDQAIAVIRTSARESAAQKFLNFVTGDQGQAILQRYGYEKP